MSWESRKAFSDDPKPSKHLGTPKTQYPRESPRTKKLIHHRISWWREVNEGRRRLPRLVYNLFFNSTARVSCIVSPPSISSHRSSCLPPVLRTLYYTWPPSTTRYLLLLPIRVPLTLSFAWLLTSGPVRFQFLAPSDPKTQDVLHSSKLGFTLRVSTTPPEQQHKSGGREVRNKCLIPVRFTIQLYLRYSDLLSTDSAAAVYFFLTVVIVVVVVLLILRGQFRTPRRRDLRLMSLLLRQRKETNDLIRRPF